MEAGDCVRTVPDTSRSLKHEDKGAGDRAAVRRKRNVTVTVDSAVIDQVHMEKPLSTTSLSTYNVDVPAIATPRNATQNINLVKGAKLTGWAEKEDLYCISTESSKVSPIELFDSKNRVNSCHVYIPCFDS